VLLMLEAGSLSDGMLLAGHCRPSLLPSRLTVTIHALPYVISIHDICLFICLLIIWCLSINSSVAVYCQPESCSCGLGHSHVFCFGWDRQ